jgi:hypothetical protein
MAARDHAPYMALVAGDCNWAELTCWCSSADSAHRRYGPARPTTLMYCSGLRSAAFSRVAPAPILPSHAERLASLFPRTVSLVLSLPFPCSENASDGVIRAKSAAFSGRCRERGSMGAHVPSFENYGTGKTEKSSRRTASTAIPLKAESDFNVLARRSGSARCTPARRRSCLRDSAGHLGPTAASRRGSGAAAFRGLSRAGGRKRPPRSAR